MLGDPEVVAKAREWVVTLLEMEAFLRERTENPGAWQALLERQRAGREGYYTAVRNDLALPPGHSARWPVLPVPGGTGSSGSTGDSGGRAGGG